MTIARFSRRPAKDKPHAYREPHRPSAQDALRARQLAARRVSPPADVVALLRLHNAPPAQPARVVGMRVTAFPEPARAGEAVRPGWKRDDTKRGGTRRFAHLGGKYRVREIGSSWHAGLVVDANTTRPGGMPTRDGGWLSFPTADAAMDAVDALIASERPAKPSWRDAGTYDAALVVLGAQVQAHRTTDSAPVYKVAPDGLVALQEGVYQARGCMFGTDWRAAIAHALGESAP